MQKALTSNKWYEHLIEDCKNLVTEGVFASRWTLVVTMHSFGHRVNEDEEKAKPKYGDQYCHSVAQSLKMREREVYRATQFAKKFPDLDKLPGGKNVSWHRICNELLADKKKESEEKVKCVCPVCGRNHDLKEEK